MNVRPRRTALAILLLLAFTAATWGMGGREDPLRYADTLIAEQKYDEAIVYIADFMKKYPDRFDAAQKKMRQITRIRAAYNTTAEELIKTMLVDPTNQEKKLAMIRTLENLEKVPNPAIQDFVAKTKDLSLFTYNRAQFELIMAEGRSLIDSGRYLEAARRYESGFALYRPEFLELGLDQALVDTELERVASVTGSIISFEAQSVAMRESFTALSEAYRAADQLEIEQAWGEAVGTSQALAATRRFVVDTGRQLEATFETLTAKAVTVTENSFLPFAYRLVLGRRTEGKLEGVAGSIDAQWIGAIGLAQTALDETLSAGIESARSSFDRGEFETAGAGFLNASLLADRGVALMSLWSHYAPSDMIERSTLLGQAALELKGQEYLRFIHAAKTARVYASLAAVQARLSADDEALAAYEPVPDQPSASLAVFEAKRLEFIESQKDIEAIRAESGASATLMATWTQAGYGSEYSQIEQGALDGRIDNASLRARSFETKAIAAASSFQYGLFSSTYERALAATEEGRELLAGVASDDPLIPDATFKYPGKALQSLASAEAIMTKLLSDIDAFIESIRARPAYVASDASVLEWSERARQLASAMTATGTEMASLKGKATEQKQLADSSKLEADRRLAESRAALRANNFETARERLDRARERYLASLSFEQNPDIRRDSDRILAELAASIVKTENDLVVAETRRLVTSGRSLYLQGEFDRAENSLLQAKSRWSTTNSTPEVEVEYWLKLVQTALSVKTGRDIPVTAPLFPEMSQLLSLAKQYYETGADQLAKRDKTGAIRTFNLARQKISEVKVVFPLNQEARVLELKIDQLSDPDEFGRKFARMFNESKTKIDTRIDLTTAYTDLQDLATINPRYPGLAALIDRAEILLGFKQAPPDARALAESRSLLNAAQRIVDSGQVAQFPFARTQLEKALSLDPNNAAAGALKDRIATYIGGDTAIVLSSAAETLYNQAVTFFTNGDYINARASLTRLSAGFPQGRSMQKVADLDARLTARGY